MISLLEILDMFLTMKKDLSNGMKLASLPFFPG